MEPAKLRFPCDSRKVASHRPANSQLQARSIARPFGRAWIETKRALWATRVCPGIARPFRRAWLHQEVAPGHPITVAHRDPGDPPGAPRWRSQGDPGSPPGRWASTGAQACAARPPPPAHARRARGPPRRGAWGRIALSVLKAAKPAVRMGSGTRGFRSLHTCVLSWTFSG